MKILVTGGAGFIGSHLVEALLANGDAVRVIDNLSTGKLENLPGGHPALEFVRGDIQQRPLVDSAVQGVDAIVHLAAVASVQASVEDPAATHGSNFDGTLNLLEAARRHGVRRIIYASSAAVYGDVKSLPIGEDSPLQPLTPYATDKLAGEYYLDFYYRQYGIASIAFRFFNIYGPRQDPASPYSGVISIFADRARAGLPVTVFGDGQQTRDFVFVGDLVQVLVKALQLPDLTHEVINVGTDRAVSLLQLLEELEQIVGRPVERRFAAAREGDIRHSLANVSRLRSRLGMVPSAPLRSGLQRLLSWLGANGMK